MSKTPNQAAKWTKWMITVPKSVDVAVRTHLAQEGLRKGDLSRFAVEAMAGLLARRNVDAMRERNGEVAPEVLSEVVSRAVRAVRAETFKVRPS